MGGLSNAVQWWEEWQLRILVLGSLGVQCYLAFFASSRKKHIRPLFRFSIWLAYIGGDALAIYALATLFNRQKKVRYTSVDGSHNLEVLWTPILLMHLGGQLPISGYNIEDNELWTRHIVTAVSQVTVALYVFCKSWSSSADGRLLAAAILLFILGVYKCFERPLALNRNSFNSLVSTFQPADRTKTTNRVELEGYIRAAREIVYCDDHPPDEELQHLNNLSIPDNLFFDCAYAHPVRLGIFQSFWLLGDKSLYEALCAGLSRTFTLIYSKEPQNFDWNRCIKKFDHWCSLLLMLFTMTLPVVPIILFHCSHKEAYRSIDIKVTFSLLYITYFLEISSFFTVVNFLEDWHDKVAQHNLIGFLAHNRRHTWLMGKDFLAQYFFSKRCHSSKNITNLVQHHVKNGWMNYITDIESYCQFSDIRGHWTLEDNGCEEDIGASIEKPFDESIILWHVATDFCFHHKGTSSSHEYAKRSREISNYMVHLLFANPEMLIPGSRRTLFTEAYKELEGILRGEDLSGLDEKKIAERIIDKMGSSKEGIVHDSWVLAQKLMKLGEDTMWGVIKGVWIEMLCFSAGRCRGYLHARSLGSGGEYLTFVSLLMSHAGLETFAERQQRVKLWLSKEERQERVRIANQRIQEAASKKSNGDPSTDQGRVPVKEGENAATLSASEARVMPLKEEDYTATVSASQGNEGVVPGPEIKIDVSST